MKYEKLNKVVRTELSNLNLKINEKNICILSEQDYDQIFWTLLKAENNPSKSVKKVKFTAQLNSYVDSNRSSYSADFLIKNPAKLIRPSPPIREDNINEIQEVVSFDTFFIQSLEMQELSDEALFGRLLYCAVRHGGLLNQSHLNSFLSLLYNKQLQSAKGLIWFELRGSANEPYNWTPDNLTVLLIKHWYNTQACFEIIRSPEHYLRRFLLLNPAQTRTNIKLSWLFRVINSLLYLSLTPFSLPLLTGKEINLTLKLQPLLRLISEKTPPLSIDHAQPEESSKTHAIPSITQESTNSKSFLNSKALLTSVKQQLREYKKRKHNDAESHKNPNKSMSLANAIKNEPMLKENNILPVTKLLVEWTHSRLTRQSRWSGKLKPSTLLSYLGSVAIPLQVHIGYRDPLNMSIDELEDIYLLIIDAGKNTAVKARRAKILRDFHILLELDYQVKPCYIFQSFIVAGNKDQANLVDANILMPWEYDNAIDFLQQSAEITGLFDLKRKAVSVSLILGFRCGLRRSELLFLKLSDLEWSISNENTIPNLATLIIWPSQARELKSISAKRRLPIGHLLNEQEKNIFADYCTERLKLGLEDSEFLFYFGDKSPLFSRDAQVVHANHLFMPLTTLLQRVTGDNTFRFHHLRHSFATWLFWYWTADIHKFSHPIPALQKHPTFKHLTDAKNHIFNRNEDQPARNTLHTISSFIGHSGPSITLCHYIHSAHWIIWSDLQQQLPDLTDKAKATLSGFTTRTLYREINKKEHSSTYFDGFNRFIQNKLAEHVSNIYPESIVCTDSWLTLSPNTIAPLTQITPTAIDELLIYDALLQHVNNDVNRTTCIKNYNIDEMLFDKAIANVHYFFSQQQSPHKYGKVKLRFKNSSRRGYIGSQKVKKVAVDKLVKIPKQENIQLVIGEILNRYNVLPVDDQKKVILAAKYMVDFCDIEWSDLRFRKTSLPDTDGEKWLKLWYEVIKLISIDDDYIQNVRLTLVCRYQFDSEERQYWWDHWTKELPNFNRDDRYDPKYPKTAAIHLDIMSRLETEDWLNIKELNKNEPIQKRNRPPALQGFRLAFYILFFIHHDMDEL
ncbi:tyrosine-type recombinase/integrase [Alishewanella sp. HL-SH06]|uniref:tyrosine-type recombinase/integrase n=1 Tax=Alishewanella sp. HL-SH06 TaxID=3461144 RepID=UPI004041F543